MLSFLPSFFSNDREFEATLNQQNGSSTSVTPPSSTHLMTPSSPQQYSSATMTDALPPPDNTTTTIPPGPIAMEDRTLSELQTMGIWELDTTPASASGINSCAWRAIVCMICMGMVWATSSPVIYSLVTYTIASPSFGETWATWKVVFNTATNEIENANDCTDGQYDQCIIDMNIGLNNFAQSMDGVFQTFIKAEIIGEELVTACNIPYTDILRGFSNHIAWGGKVNYNQTSCTTSEIVQIRKIIGDNSDASAWTIADTLDTVGSSFNGQFSNITTTMQARMWYDNTYWNGSLTNLKDDLAALEQTLNDLEATWTSFRSQFDVFNPSTIFPIFDWGNIHPLSLITTWMNTLIQVWNAARSAWTEVLKVAAGVGLTFPSVDEIFPIGILTLDDMTLAFSTGKNYITTTLSQEINMLSSELSTIGSLAQENMQYTYLSIETDISNWTSTYIPVNISFDKLYDEFGINNTVTTLRDYVTQLGQYVGEMNGDAESTVRELLTKIDLIPDYVNKFNIPGILHDKWDIIQHDISIDPIFHVFNTIISVLLAFDIIYRVEQTLQLLLYYLQQTVSQLPVLDLRRDGDQHQTFDWLSRLPWSFLSTMTSVLLLIIFAIGSFVYVIIAYSELYGYYLDGCVHGNSGTFLATNAKQLTYNICNDTSRFYRWTQEQDYTATRWISCKNATYELQTEYLNYSTNIIANQQFYQTYYNNLILLNKCIIPDTTYTNINPIEIINNSDTNYFPIPKPLIGQYLLYDETQINPIIVNSSIIRSLSSIGACTSFALIDFPFNNFSQSLPSPDSCSTFVPTCTFGECYPDENIILSSTIRSSCYTWWLAHSFLIRWVLIALTTICINVSRICVIGFLTTYLYDKLGSNTVDIIEFYKYRTCVSTVSDRDRKLAIYKAKKHHKCRAVIFLVIGLLCNVPWLAFLFYFLKNTSPQANL